MSDIDDLALRLVAAKVLKDLVAAVDADARAQMTTLMKVGARAIAELPDGTPVGAVTYSKARQASATVTDPDAFAAWVQRFYPSEIVHRPEQVIPAHTTVRDSFRMKALADVVKTGELPDGVEMGRAGTPSLTVPKLPEGAADAIYAAFRSGALPSLLELPGAGE